MSKVYFSSVWEDYLSLREGLNLSENDVVLSVSSSGDNIFNFLSDRVKKVIAVDINPAQLNLVKLKSKIISECEPQRVSELLTGVGDKDKNKFFLDTLVSSDGQLKKYLTSYNFARGVDNIGEFENKVLPIITFFAKRFFKSHDFKGKKTEKKRANFWFKVLSIIFSFKKTYKFLLPDFPYQYININIGKSLKKSLENFLTFNDLSSNWYVQKIYYGRYELLPPFLRSDNFQYIKDNLDKVVFVEKDILNFLKENKDCSIDKINLSDIFDWCSREEYSQILQEAYRVLSPNGIIFYWEFFVSRELPKNMINKYEILNEKANKIHERDNIPFYHRIVILKKRKGFVAKE